MRITIHCDGGARGNPGPAASAFIVHDETGEVVHEAGFYLGEATNNIAEYTALLKAYEWLLEFPHLSDISSLTCIFDSELVVKQITGVYNIKSPHLAVLAQSIKRLESRLPVTPVYRHVLRADNREADLLVNQTLDNSAL